jgi:hypothetical protein
LPRAKKKMSLMKMTQQIVPCERNSLPAMVRDFLESTMALSPAHRSTAGQLLQTPLMKKVVQLHADLLDPAYRDRILAAYMKCFPRLHSGVDSSALAAQLQRQYLPEPGQQQQQQQAAEPHNQDPAFRREHYALWTLEEDAKQVLEEEGSEAPALLKQQVLAHGCMQQMRRDQGTLRSQQGRSSCS